MRHQLKRAALAAAAVLAGVVLPFSAFPAAAADSADGAVVWGGTTHTTPESLEAWLTERGLSYAQWRYQHPLAALRLERAAEERERDAEPIPLDLDGIGSVAASVGPGVAVGLAVAGIVLALSAAVLSSPALRFHPALRFASDRRGFFGLGGAALALVATASYVLQV